MVTEYSSLLFPCNYWSRCSNALAWLLLLPSYNSTDWSTMVDSIDWWLCRINQFDGTGFAHCAALPGEGQRGLQHSWDCRRHLGRSRERRVCVRRHRRGMHKVTRDVLSKVPSCLSPDSIKSTRRFSDDTDDDSRSLITRTFLNKRRCFNQWPLEGGKRGESANPQLFSQEAEKHLKVWALFQPKRRLRHCLPQVLKQPEETRPLASVAKHNHWFKWFLAKWEGDV